MAAAGLPVPDGFVVTVAAFREFLAASGIEARVCESMERLNVEDTAALLADLDAALRLAARVGRPLRTRA